MLDPETINEIAAEERAYRQWERKEKNRILNMHNEERKSEEWHKLFPPLTEPDDSYLEGNIY